MWIDITKHLCKDIVWVQDYQGYRARIQPTEEQNLHEGAGASEAENLALAAVRERSEDIQMSDDSPSHMNQSSVPLAGAGMAKIDQEKSIDEKDVTPMSDAQMISIIKSNSKAYIEVLGQVAKDMTSC